MIDLRKELIAIAKEMEVHRINQGTSGNLSVRIQGGLLITPSSISYKEMSYRDLLAIDYEGNLITEQADTLQTKGLKPSSEWRLHADILKTRVDINAVLHCHSIHATALSCHGKSIPSFHYMTAIAGGRDILCAKYATFGSQELSNNAIEALQQRSACLLEHHGQIAVANNINNALKIAIEIETLAQMYLTACQLGEPKTLGSKEMDIVLKKFKDLKYQQ